MTAWLNGVRKVMVSTSILGCGLDYPSVRDVVHVDVAYSMLDQHQQESRGGRDGKISRATTYVPLGRIRPLVKDSADFGQKELYDWAEQDKQCLRSIPSQYLDGVYVNCAILPGCAPCAYCAQELEPSTPTFLPGRPTAPTLTSSPPQASSFRPSETSSNISRNPTLTFSSPQATSFRAFETSSTIFRDDTLNS